ncbi:MAG: cellulase family glycosylhydrolase [Lachnospiraceae bacterium]|nr:cellulase family glycosylhydrolase [Lachnospiraceae bacterium]
MAQSNTTANTPEPADAPQVAQPTKAPQDDTNTDQKTDNTQGSKEDSASDNAEPQPTTEPTEAPADAKPDKEASDQKADTEQPTPEPLPEDAFTLTINNDDTWGENPKYYRMNMMLTNNMEQAINGWVIRVNVGDGAAIDSGWRGKYTLEGDTLCITNEDHNAKVPAGGTIDFGLIISNVSGDLSYTVEALGTESAGSGNNSQNNGQSVNSLAVPEPTTDDWLHVEGNKIVDSEGKQVWLTGVNWFGYNTGTNIFDGIWNSDLNTSIQSIADHGFNLIRIPMSAELILQWKNGEYPTANYNHATNYYLENMNSLEIFDYVIGQCRANGMKIMIDIHSAKTDAAGHNANMWYNGDITTEKFQEALVWMAERYAKDDTIIAYDLKNEPHGKPFETDKAIWNDSKDKNNWKYIAEQTALKILEKNPNVLIMVEGTEIYPIDIKANGDYSSTNDKDYYFNWWGGNLRGVADYPIDLGKYQDQLVYSPHDYGPTVYQQPWFYDGYDFDSLYEDCWRDNWMYIYEDGTAPLLIGEWGGFMRDPNLTWMTHMRTLISKNKLHHTFWCFNANSGDTGGLVLDDFKTWDEEKYAFVKEVLWQENGKFVGLDHEIPLGTAGNGITLSEAKGLK